MGRSPCCEKVGLKKGSWTPEEDQKLTSYIQEHGHGSWRALPVKAGLQRCGKSCRLRWTNYLRPDIKRGKFTLQEEQTMIQLHALLGNRWSAIATHLPKRTDNEIKNYWNTHLKKRLIKMGIDPVTHKSKNYALGSGSGTGQSKEVANLSHMAQWESARLEAEARFVREYKHSSGSVLGHPLIQRQHQHHYKQISSIPCPPTTLDVVNAWQSLWSSGSESDCAAFGDSVFSSSEDVLPIGTLPISTENSRKKKDEINDWNDHCVQVEVPSATTPFPGMQSTWINAEAIGNEDNVFVEGSYHTILPVPDNSSSFGEDYSDNVNGNCTAGSLMVHENNHFWNNIVSLLDSSSAYSFENV